MGMFYDGEIDEPRNSESTEEPKWVTAENVARERRFPQVPSTAEYPNIVNVVPMGSPQGQSGTFVESDKKPEQESRLPLTVFEQKLRSLINAQSMEKASNTPDYILAEYLGACLSAFNYATRAREQWYGRKVF